VDVGRQRTGVKSIAQNSQNLAKNKGGYYHIQGLRLAEKADSHFLTGLIADLLNKISPSV
ncbi:hypothetical protein ACRTC8_22220, partial [Vibrio cholerae]|uniref:hypothetical protein n=1 Tax=Vibrio cholerae TaxID=666 RepID=UPI003D7E7B01